MTLYLRLNSILSLIGGSIIERECRYLSTYAPLALVRIFSSIFSFIDIGDLSILLMKALEVGSSSRKILLASGTSTT
jgi:hypothetical protein